MLTVRMKRLRDTFNAWSRGEPYPSEEQWLWFRNELRELSFQVAMLELGVDLTVVDTAVATARNEMGSNVVNIFTRERITANGDGEAS